MADLTRRALIQKGHGTTAEVVARYLPANYRVTGEDDEHVAIEGADMGGWTLDDYVLPRLASGLHFGCEVVMSEHVATPGEGITLNEWNDIIVDDSLVREVREALEGDSNDAEHDALASIANALGIPYKTPDPYLDDELEN